MSQPGQPYPHDIWLRVKLDGVPLRKRHAVVKQLRQLEGWNTSFVGDVDGSLRYRYAAGRQVSIPRRARQIIVSAGGSDANVASFVVWRMDVAFRRALGIDVFAPMTQAMDELPGVMNTNILGSGPALTGVYVEFRGKPGDEVLARVKALVAPHVAP